MTVCSHSPVIVVAPDSFKGSVDAEGVAQAIERGIRRAVPSAQVLLYPMADGGEGSLKVMLGRDKQSHAIFVSGAAGHEIETELGLLGAHTAIIETARIVGITDPVAMAVKVGSRHTWGLGQAVQAAIDTGAQKILVALGGSCTNDAGAGMLAALGVRFWDRDSNPVEPQPDKFQLISRVDISGLDTRVLDTKLVGLSDVENPLTGPSGATAVFGPQKGILGDEILRFDHSLTHFADLCEDAFQVQCRKTPGAGAAGGLGFALLLLGGRLASGAQTVADEIGLQVAIQRANWVITGEGRTDSQTLDGKAPIVVSRLAKAHGVPVTLLSGAVDPSALPVLENHFNGCFSPAPGPITLAEAIADAPRLLEQAAEQLARLFLHHA